MIVSLYLPACVHMWVIAVSCEYLLPTCTMKENSHELIAVISSDLCAVNKLRPYWCHELLCGSKVLRRPLRDNKWQKANTSQCPVSCLSFCFPSALPGSMYSAGCNLSSQRTSTPINLSVFAAGDAGLQGVGRGPSARRPRGGERGPGISELAGR